MPDLPPFDVEAEEAVIATMLLDHETIPEMRAMGLSANDFYRDVNRECFTAIAKLFDKGEVVNELTVGTIFKDRAYLATVTANLPAGVTGAFYARSVMDTAVRRRLIQAGNHIIQTANREVDAIKSLTEAAGLIETVSKTGIKESLDPLADYLHDWLDQPPTHDRGVLTGWPNLNHVLGSLRNGSVYIVAARPGQGKTSFMLALLRDCLKNGKRSLVFSLEMAPEDLVTRLLSNVTGIDSRRLEERNVSDREGKAVNQALGELADAVAWIDSRTRDVKEIGLRARAHALRNPVDIVFIDYLQLAYAEGRSIVERVTNISNSMPGLAKDLGCPVIVLSQLNRAIEQRSDGRPQLSDLRESGAIEQDAAGVIFLYHGKEMRSDSHSVELIVAKNRYGRTANVNVWFDPQTARFRDTEVKE